MSTPTGREGNDVAAGRRATLGLEYYNEEEDFIEEDESSREEEQEARSTTGATLAKASEAVGVLARKGLPRTADNSALGLPSARRGSVLLVTRSEEAGMVQVRSVHPSTVLGSYEVIYPSDFRDHGMPAVPKIPWGTFQGEVAVEVEPNPAKAGQGQATAYTGTWLAAGTAKFRAARAAGVGPEPVRSWSVERFLRGLRYDLFPAATEPSPAALEVGGGEPAPARWVSPEWLARFEGLAQVLGGFELAPASAGPPASVKISVARVRELLGWILPAWAEALAGAEMLELSELHSVFQSLDWEVKGSFSTQALATAPMSVPGSCDPATDPRARFFREHRFPGFSPAPHSRRRSGAAQLDPPAAGGMGLFGASPGAATAATAEAAAAAAVGAAVAATAGSRSRDPRLRTTHLGAGLGLGDNLSNPLPPAAQILPAPPAQPSPLSGLDLANPAAVQAAIRALQVMQAQQAPSTPVQLRCPPGLPPSCTGGGYTGCVGGAHTELPFHGAALPGYGTAPGGMGGLHADPDSITRPPLSSPAIPLFQDCTYGQSEGDSSARSAAETEEEGANEGAAPAGSQADYFARLKYAGVAALSNGQPGSPSAARILRHLLKVPPAG